MAELNRYLALAKEWFYPAQIGAYYDGERFYLAEDEQHPGRRPARVFVALSHRLFFYHAFKVPRNLDTEALMSAARLEAQRIFALLKGRKSGELACAVVLRRSEEALVVFQEKEVLEQILNQLPEGLIPCGIMPAGLAAAAYFYQKDKDLPPGLYYLRTEQVYEGVVLDKTGVRDLLPASPGAAEAFLESWEGAVFTSQEALSEELLAQGARAFSALPRAYWLPLDLYPLRPRPKPSLTLLLVWLLPLLVLVSGQGLRYQAHRLSLKTQALDQRITKLKRSLAEIEDFQQKKQAYQKIQEVSQDWQKDDVDLVAVITRLAELFPEHTWVRRLEFRAPNELRLWAEGQNALEILKLLDADPMFDEVKFLTTVTKNTRTGKEVFSLVLKIKAKE